MKIVRYVLALAVAILVPSVASAQNVYVGIRGGPGWTPDHSQGLIEHQDAISFKTGFTGSGAVGYASSFGLRVEGEFGYIYAPVDSEEGLSIGGSIKNYLFMLNGYYDLKTAALGPFKPYVGFGLGAARVHEDRQSVHTDPFRVVDLDRWRTAFAYQARAGVGYEVNTWLDLSVGYRYVHINGADLRGSVSPFPPIRSGAIQNHSLELGAAFKF